MKTFKTSFFILSLSIAISFIYYSCSPKVANEVEVVEPTPLPPNTCGPTKADLSTAPGKDGTLAPLFDGLDVYNYPITTSSTIAQQYFNQGFILQYGFNHAEASRSFREAINQDPECAMCYWGLAYVIGPNYNAPMDPEVLSTAHDAINNARLYSHKATPKEVALIDAISKRYPKNKEEDPTPYYNDYANAMRQVNEEYGNEDIDIQVMTAEALLDLHPWDLFTQEKEEQPWTPEILEILEGALKKDPNHPQACHLYIHAVEAGPNPEKGEPYADNLRMRVPGSGHLLHMPSHLYINIGEYHKGVLANELAVKEDSLYVASCHMAGIYPLAYYPHNWHFLAACAGLEGNGTRALEASRYMADHVVAKDLMRLPGLHGLQHFVTIPWFIQIKFNNWNGIMKEPRPDSDLRYPVAIWSYAQGMALARKNEFDKAKQMLDTLSFIAKNPAMAESPVSPTNTAIDVILVAEQMLMAEIALQSGSLEEALAHFKKGVVLEDQLRYIEPPDWFFSVRHHLGDVLLKAQKYEEAEEVYRKDLTRFKNNGWALNGLRISLEKQGKKAEAQSIERQFDEAWKYADVQLSTSVI